MASSIPFVYMAKVSHLQYKGKREQANRPKILETVKELGIPLIDAHPTFLALDDPMKVRFSPESHCNPAGYKLLLQIHRGPRAGREVTAATAESLRPRAGRGRADGVVEAGPMKARLSLLCASATVLAIAACSGSKEDPSASGSTGPATTTVAATATTTAALALTVEGPPMKPGIELHVKAEAPAPGPTG